MLVYNNLYITLRHSLSPLHIKQKFRQVENEVRYGKTVKAIIYRYLSLFF